MAETDASAPGQLELVRAFVNTLDVEDGEDALSTSASTAAWLAGHGLIAPGERVRPQQRARVIAVREAIRALLAANNGESLDLDAPAVLDAASRWARLGLRFEPDGRALLVPEARGAASAVGRLLAIVSAAMADGTWSRLKACRAPDCRWAFYDRARNRSRTWCAMSVCGNRTKARAYRMRHSG